MKRRKRMGMYKAPAISPRVSIETTAAPHAHGVVEPLAVPIHDTLQSAFESTPERFVAFVNRMTATEASRKSFR